MLTRLGWARIAFLDQIRAIAIVAVVVSHFHSDWLPSGGAVGVGVFFALSGFLIASILLEEQHCDLGTVIKFIVRRFMRIYSAYLVAVSATAILTFLYKPENLSAIISAVPGVLSFVRGYHFIGYGFAVLWTLQVEMAFYLIVPLVMLALGRTKGLLIICAAMIALSVLVLFGFPSLSIVQIYAGDLAFGALLSLMWKSGLFEKMSVRAAPLLCASLAAMAILGFLHGNTGLAWMVEILCASLCGCMLITAFLLQPSLPVLPAAPWIGRISYSIYLLHGILIDFHIVPNAIFTPFYWIYRSQNFAFAGTFFVLSAGLGAVSYYAVEKPGIRIGKRLTAMVLRSPQITGRVA